MKEYRIAPQSKGDRANSDLAAGQTRPFLRWGLGAVVLLGAGAFGLWTILAPKDGAAPSAKPAAAGKPATRVLAVTAQKGEIPIFLEALGTVTPVATVTVKTQISGQLTQVGFQEGQLVKAGDFLAQIDPRPYELALAQYEGQLRKDQALLKAAQNDLARYRTLFSQDSIAKQQLDTQEALVQQYEGTVQTDQAQVGNARLNLTYCHIVAPVSGRTGLRQVDPGNYLQASDANGIVVVTPIQPINVTFSIAEDHLGAVHQRLRAGAELPVVVFDRAQTGELARGKVATLDNQIDTTTGTVKLRAHFDNEKEALYPNQFVNVRILVDQVKDATLLPVAAVQHGAIGTYVYLIRADGTVALRPVKLGAETGDQAVVQEGVQPGDQVVTEGADRLREGSPVVVASKDQPAGPVGRKGGKGKDQEPGKQEAGKPDSAKQDPGKQDQSKQDQSK